MRIIEIQQEDKQIICAKLEQANKALEEAMFKLKESSSESDTRMWRAEGDYRGMSGGNYRMDDYPRYRDEERRYRDDFRYRG